MPRNELLLIDRSLFVGASATVVSFVLALFLAHAKT
jgi:hypothetical protein